MVKLVAFLKRKPGLTLEEFYDHWENRHGPLIANTPELARHIVRYEQHRRTALAGWMGTEGFDGVTIQWMASPAAFEAFVAEPAYAELIAPDEQRFLDTDSLVWMVTSEPTIVIDGPPA
ncbi:EthD domain-containing protein [Rhabdothermincola sp.]|uniref:EthD domain-containing protein n=1 Tax=Rhabdothermincola sp. TaxID=2820405 RepID=UPI002FE23164